MTQTANSTGPLVLVGAQNGIALIPSPTPLTRLNYFDGKFLRAEDLNREQHYLRSLVELSNQAGGAGVVHGFTTTLGSAGNLQLTPGLAIDPAGRVLYLPHEASVSIIDLIERSKEVPGSSSAGSGPSGIGEGAFSPCEGAAVPPPSVTTTFPTDLYLIALAHAEALCGEEDVYGKLCEEACITSTDRPFRLEGVVVRAIPLSLCPPTCNAPWLTAKHRRSLVASAYFATERALHGKDMSGARLKLDLWCHGAGAQSGTVVPLAIVSVNGGAVEFLDAWTARRERIEAPPRRYWAWQMMMRPWNVYLAQILQFQCHLHAVLAVPGTPSGLPDPCEDRDAALRQAVALLDEMESSYTAAGVADNSANDIFRPDFLTRIGDLRNVWTSALAAVDVPSGTRILIDGGIIELPPAGYLPVVPGNVDVNTQVRRLLGDGVDLRFCVVRPDYVAHALEEAQHMERICLLQGLDDPGSGVKVDVLVPDGTITAAPAAQGLYFETSFGVIIPSITPSWRNDSVPTETVDPATGGPLSGSSPPGMANTGTLADNQGTARLGPQFRGAGRSERLAGSGGAFHFAGLMVQTVDQVSKTIRDELSGADFPNRAEPMAESARKSSTIGLGDFDLGELISRFGPKASDPETAGASINARNHYLNDRQNTVTPTVPALWTTMRCEKDPLELAIGESTPLRFEAAVGMTYQDTVVGAQLMLQGDLYCDQKPSSGTARRVKGRAWGWVWANARLQRGSQVATHQAQPHFIPVTATTELKPESGGGVSLVITVATQEGYEFSINTSWKGSPILGGVSIAFDFIDTLRAIANRGDDPERRQILLQFTDRLEEMHPEYHALEIARARLQENAAVRNEDNSHHAAAVKALRTIEKALDQDGFRETAGNLLFPPAPPPAAGKRVLPTRDWVLFHRRRDNSCDCCPPTAKVVAPARRFQVYEITAPEAVSVAEIREALAGGEDISRFSEIVGVVEFQGGTATLIPSTDPTEIQRAWRLANPESAIVYGGLASEGGAINDPEALGEHRIARVGDLVQSITPLHPASQFDVLPLVPNGLSAQGVDGVIFLVTIPARVQTQSHLVLSLTDQGMMDETLRMIAAGQFRAVVAQNRTLGTVEFAAGSADVINDSLEPVIQAWHEHWDTRTGRVLVVRPAQNPIASNLAVSQANTIVAPLNGSVTEPVINSVESVFGAADAITILEPRFEG